MTLSRVDTQFAAFCRGGDPQQLAAVFDATAAELLRVARHLAADGHAAEDLVQATFLKAIERRDRYRAELPVLPWLLGILANHARDERRRRRRQEPPAVAGADVSALESAANVERRAQLLAAVRGLPATYREVLLLQVEHGLDSGEIAEVTGRKAATVRTQIARGLELLRSALPVGVVVAAAAPAQGAAAAASPGLAAVRDVVLQHAAGATAGAGAVGTAVVLGGLAMKKGLAVAVVAFLLTLAAGSWWSWRPGDAPSSTAPAAAVVGAAPRSESRPAEATGGASTAAGAQRETAAALALGGLRVVVRFADGAPANGVAVYLAGERLLPLGREAATDAGGVAMFADVPIGALVVKPDRGPATAFTIAPGANELELRLPTGVEVVGVVRDARGQAPIPHATIHALSREHHDRAQRLGQADAEGAFTLRAVPPGTHLFARAPGWQPGDPRTESVGMLAKSPKRVDLRVGARAFALRGRVTQPDGAPASFAQVAIAVDEHADRFVDGLRGRSSGMQRQRDVDAFLLRADGNGDYATDEVPEGEALVVARPAAGHPPGIAIVPVQVLAGADNRCDVVLQPGAQLVGTVRDEKGAPFADMPLLAEWKGTPAIRFEGAFTHLLGCVAATTDEGGHYRLQGLLPGDHDVTPQAWLDDRVRMQSHGDQQQRVTLLGAESRRLDLTVPRRGDLRVRLLGPTGEPVVGWGIWVSAGPRPTPRMAQLEAQRTDAAGRTCIGGLLLGTPMVVTAFGPGAKEAGDRLVDRMPARQWHDVHVQPAEIELRLVAADLPTAALSGHFVDSVGAPLAMRDCELHREQWDERRHTKVVAGVVRFVGLPAGRYWLRPAVGERPLLGPFDLQPGEQRDLGPVRIPAAGSLRVVVRVTDGGSVNGLRGALVATWSNERTNVLDVRGDSMHATAPLPGAYRLWVWATDLAASAHDVEVLEGQERTLQLLCPRGFAQPFAVASPATTPAKEGWLVDYDLFTADGLLVLNGQSPSRAFTLPLASGNWLIRWNLPGGPRTSTPFTLAGDQPAPAIVLKPD